jgi:hypothetical protein
MAAAGRSEEARALHQSVQAMIEKDPMATFAQAAFFSALGEKDRAVDSLEHLYQMRIPSLTHLRVMPSMEPLHGMPRFEELARKIGLPGK